MCVMGAILIYIELFIKNNDVNNDQGVVELEDYKRTAVSEWLQYYSHRATLPSRRTSQLLSENQTQQQNEDDSRRYDNGKFCMT